ncbi:hypothetical protein LOTGIDRAFT_152239 [Lottia gigantea]|uniref:Uncharacterized protein n=1 Tax=Lottia gigantea TaxID=225164 RepID=V4AMI9_LOTGI|nr:hypothetical protein LOTGIDRAFT_152239 [Lottia gigantea]ESP05389.1 hypothetical protein LOTGIDRAFT_152239 [Lottia gigantea]
MLKTVLYPKDFDSVSGWIPDVGSGSVLKEPVRNVANDADLDRVRVVARNTIERVARAANHGFEKRVLQYNNIVENNRNYKNMCELFGNLPQFKYVDFALNHPIFCFDLSAHQEDLFKTGVNMNIHIEKTQGDVTGYCLLLEEAKHLIKIADRRMIRIE